MPYDDRISFVNSGNTGQMLISSMGSSTYFAWVNTAGGGASTVVYAPTGGSYVVWQPDVGLADERVLAAGSSITFVNSGTSFFINALTNAAGGSTVYFPDDFVFVAANAEVWTNMPAAPQVLFGNSGNIFCTDLTNATSARALVTTVVAGSAPATFYFQASTDSGVTWQAFINATSHLAVNIGVARINTSVWVLFNTALRKDEVFFRIIGSSGNGAIDPSFGHISLQVR